MPGQLDPLPRGEVEENLPPGFLELGFDLLDLRVETDAQRVALPMFSEVRQIVLQFDDRLLEIELMFHGGSLGGVPRVRQR